jgi:hypothetical protein
VHYARRIADVPAMNGVARPPGQNVKALDKTGFAFFVWNGQAMNMNVEYQFLEKILYSVLLIGMP